MKYGKKFGNREITDSKKVIDFPKEAQEQYYKQCAEIQHTVAKAMYEAEKNYQEVVAELNKHQEDAMNAVMLQLQSTIVGVGDVKED